MLPKMVDFRKMSPDCRQAVLSLNIHHSQPPMPEQENRPDDGDNGRHRSAELSLAHFVEHRRVQHRQPADPLDEDIGVEPAGAGWLLHHGCTSVAVHWIERILKQLLPRLTACLIHQLCQMSSGRWRAAKWHRHTGTLRRHPRSRAGTPRWRALLQHGHQLLRRPRHPNGTTNAAHPGRRAPSTPPPPLSAPGNPSASPDGRPPGRTAVPARPALAAARPREPPPGRTARAAPGRDRASRPVQ